MGSLSSDRLDGRWSVDGVREHTETHKNLEWFEPPERNTLHPLFLYCSSNILDEASVCDLPEESLSISRVGQA
jgi:hypothetical protein